MRAVATRLHGNGSLLSMAGSVLGKGCLVSTAGSAPVCCAEAPTALRQHVGAPQQGSR